jgi:hypothetical protein
MDKWININDKLPSKGEEIIAYMPGCKIGNYFIITVREGEGFGGIEMWMPVGDKAEDESHRERLNPEDARNGICDSLTTTNK